ncbi:MAG: twin-arginine translocation pathway signal protein [Pseudomonadota bacterium]
MTLSRRKMLALAGGGTILAATAGSAAFLTTRTPTRALEPWETAGGYDDPRMRALSFALLAPNPHNIQPWLVELAGSDTVILHRDPDRTLPHTDPFGRQLTIGMGCFLEQMVIAAGADGYACDMTLFPNGEGGPVARVMFAPGGARDPLADAIMERCSHKEVFDARPVGAESDPLDAYARVVRDEAGVATLRRIATDAWVAEMETDRTLKESIDLLRIGKAEINANPDGIDLGGPMMDSLKLFGLASAEQALDRTNPNYLQAVQGMVDAVASAPAFTVSVTAGNTRADQIRAGQDWLRLNLAATALGLKLRPVSQALQEYAEVSAYYEEMHALYAPDGGTVQMLGLLGYGPRTPRTPRWPLEAKLVNA